MSTTTISSLNDFVLLYIFNCLKVEDVVSFEIACYMNSAAGQIYYQKNCTEFYYNNTNHWTRKFSLAHVLKLVGPSLISLVCHISTNHLWSAEAHNAIEKYCWNLKKLDIRIHQPLCEMNVPLQIVTGLVSLKVRDDTPSKFFQQQYVMVNRGTLEQLDIEVYELGELNRLLCTTHLSEISVFQARTTHISATVNDLKLFMNIIENAQTVKFYQCSFVTNYFLLVLAMLPNLQTFNCTACHNIQNHGLLNFVKVSDSLKRLTIIWCLGLNKANLEIELRSVKKALKLRICLPSNAYVPDCM